MFDDKYFPPFSGFGDCDSTPGEKHHFTMTENMEHVTREMRATIDRLLKFECRMKQDIDERLSALTKDNVLFKNTFNEAYKLFVQEVSNSVNTHKSNTDSAITLFMNSISADYAGLSESTKAQIEESLIAYAEKLNECKAELNVIYDDFRSSIENRIDQHNSNQETAFSDFVTSLNTRIANAEKTLNEAYATFTRELNNSVNSFKNEWTRIIESRIDGQDSIIADAVAYMKTNLIASISNIVDGLIDAGAIDAITTSAYKKFKDTVCVNICDFGFVGDGINDDAESIRTAIDYAENAIQGKNGATDSFAGGIRIMLPPNKIYIKSPINIANNIVIEGHGTATTLVLAANLDYMVKYSKSFGGCITTNEESQIEGGAVRNLRFDGGNRQFTCGAALALDGVDHFVLDTVYFYSVKGKCLELRGVRESVFNNIFTRFCGVYGKGNIETVLNDGDSSNLNYGNNWNIVFPFGNAIKMVHGQFENINHLTIHGMFDEIINTLDGYFGSNEYVDNMVDFIHIEGGKINITNAFMVYAPDKSGYINAIGGSSTSLNGVTFNAHRSNSESTTSYFVRVQGESTMYINDVSVNCAYQDSPIFRVSPGCHVYGSFTKGSDLTYISDTTGLMQDYKRATRFTFAGERLEPVRMEYAKLQDAETMTNNTDVLVNMVFGCGEENELLKTNDALYIGTDTYRQRPIVAMPNDSYFVLPVQTDTLHYIENSLFIDGEGNLCVTIKNGEGVYSVKKLVFAD